MHNANTPNAFFWPCLSTLADAAEVNDMNRDDYVNNPLWHILVDTVHTLTMFSHHKAYVRDVVLVEQPEIGAEDLAPNLNISLGESLVILYELHESKAKNPKQEG